VGDLALNADRIRGAVYRAAVMARLLGLRVANKKALATVWTEYVTTVCLSHAAQVI